MFKSKFLPVFTFLFIAVLASCNFSANKSGSIFLDFTSLKGSPSAPRNLIDTYLEEEKDVYVDLTIDGLLDEPVTLNIMEQPYYEQDEIPVGTKIQVTVEAYIITNDDDPENSKYILYKGTSNKKTIGGGPNTIKILMKELTKKIYVRYADGFQEGNFIRNALENDSYETEDDEGNAITITNDGKTPSTGFFYIQSAIDWIAENGNPNYDYEIILTGYGDEVSFNQRFEFGNVNDDTDSLYGHAKSITFTSNNASVTAIKPDYPNTIIVSTVVPIIIKNIKISSCLTSNQNSTPNPLILSVGVEDISYYGNAYRPDVTLGYGTVFEGIFNEENQIPARAAYGAVHVVNGDLIMEGNSTIYGFYGNGAKNESNNYKYTAGAVFITSGSFKMTENSSISDCHASEGAYGGAIFSEKDYNSVELSGNSQIYECSAERGGAVYIQGGSLTIDGASITSCNANSYGGAIYIDATINEVNTYVKSGEIKNNSAENTENNGSGIYLEGSSTINNGIWSYSNAYLHLSDKAFIDPSNDIYLSDLENSKLYLDSELTTNAETAALITLNSASEGSTIINCANSNTSILENCFSKFCVNPTVDPQTNWYINENGELKEVNYILKDNEYDENNTLIQEADPVQVGDLVFADNSRVRPENYPYLTYQMRTSLAGIVFYAGTEDDLLGEVNLIVGKKIYSGRLEDSEQQNPIQFEKTTQFNFPRETVVKYWQDSEGNTSTTEEDVLILSEKLNIDEIQFDAVCLGNAQLTNFSDQIDSTRELTFGSTYYFPLLYSVMHYYDDLIENNNQTESEIYGYNSDDLTNNWYIPTVAEYYELYLANKNPVFNEIFSSFYNLEDHSFITATQCDDHYWRMADGPSHYYHYIINFSENIIKCDVNNNYNSTIPIHTFSLN
ncbi:MAG: hypothetical protein K6D95_05165 [Treponema sp.]|nr:hypothetical protein [Treponema sp.]